MYYNFPFCLRFINFCSSSFFTSEIVPFEWPICFKLQLGMQNPNPVFLNIYNSSTLPSPCVLERVYCSVLTHIEYMTRKDDLHFKVSRAGCLAPCSWESEDWVCFGFLSVENLRQLILPALPENWPLVGLLLVGLPDTHSCYRLFWHFGLLLFRPWQQSSHISVYGCCLK